MKKLTYDLVLAWVVPIGAHADEFETMLLDELQAELAKNISPDSPPHQSAVTKNSIVLADQIKDAVKTTDPDFQKLNSTDYKEQKQAYQSYGDVLRAKLGNGALAGFATSLIAEFRTENEDFFLRIHNIHSLKHPDEVFFLREIYGDRLIVIGAHDTYERRISTLKSRCGGSMDRARELIASDEKGEESYGQQTRELFEICDAYVDLGARNPRLQLTRLARLLLGALYIPPTEEEEGMAMAFRAAEKSIDLSRQVGAALYDSAGEIVSLGRNDVPRPGGGLYNGIGRGDISDSTLGRDPGQIHRDGLAERLAEHLHKALSNKSEDAASSKFIVESASTEEIIKLIRTCPAVRDIIEYGRSVHAEMAALSSAARVGRSVKGGILYVTTFPCHTCARHIIASGVSQVIYVEPYAKSKTIELHSDAIACQVIEPEHAQPLASELTDLDPLYPDEDSYLVLFRPFSGVSPRRYSSFFSMRTSSGRKIERKSGHSSVRWWRDDKGGLRPRFPSCTSALINREKFEVRNLFDGIDLPIGSE